MKNQTANDLNGLLLSVEYFVVSDKHFVTLSTLESKETSFANLLMLREWHWDLVESLQFESPSHCDL